MSNNQGRSWRPEKKINKRDSRRYRIFFVSAMLSLLVGAVAVGSFEEQQNNILSWVHSVLKGDLHPDARAEVVLIDKFLSMGESEAGFRETS